MQSRLDEQSYEAFRTALEALNATDIPYAIGGAFALFNYAGDWRNTNDLDLYLERRYVPEAADVLAAAGFRDFGELAAGDREWIYHGLKDGTLIDLIWQPPNCLSAVDAEMYERSVNGAFVGVPVRYLSADALIWTKTFIMNRHRCDWPDIFHVMRAGPDSLDWNYLLSKLGEHWPVLLSILVLFDWTYPGEAQAIPQWVRDDLLGRKGRLTLRPGEPSREVILDPWVYTRPVSP